MKEETEGREYDTPAGAEDCPLPKKSFITRDGKWKYDIPSFMS